MGIIYNYYWDENDSAKPYKETIMCNAYTIVPDNATRTPPPKYGAGTIPCWNGTKWVVRADWRQEVIYDITTGKRAVYPTVDVDEDYFNEHYTSLKPDSQFDKWDGEKWVLDESIQKQTKIDTLVAERKAGIDKAAKEIASISDGIEYLKSVNADTTEYDNALNKWKLYRGQLVVTKITTGDEVLPEQPDSIEG